MAIEFDRDTIRKILIGVAAAGAALVLGLVVLVAVAVQGLPDYKQLADYRPPVTSRVHAGDGSLIAEFATEHRLFVPIQEIPDHVKDAFVSVEDKSFYQHSGLDYAGIMRATVTNVVSIFTGDRMQGASTITQQVAKNMLLSSERTIMRKVKEAFLAQRIERALDKERILELYLNQIPLGRQSFGVAAASLNYFDKPLAKLTLAEAAFLGALPKGPNNYNPVTKKDAAIARRNLVLTRMVANDKITQEEADAASKEDIVVANRFSEDKYVASAHFVEQVRRQVTERLGEKALKEGGLSIRATLDTRLQVAAARAVRKGLEQYDRRHGWRGPVARVNADADPADALREVPAPPRLTGWQTALVTQAERNTVRIALADGSQRQLSGDDVSWAAQGARGKADRALRRGAAVYVQCPRGDGRCALRQVPEVEGALVAMNPHTGRVLALIGGYDFRLGDFSRVTDARRQPGSAFKPLVYAASLDPCGSEGQQGCGLTPATLIDDAPFAIEAGDGSVWAPDNYNRESYLGPTTMRVGLEKSLNTMTARLVYAMGPERVFDYASRLGVYEESRRELAVFSLGLGVGETTPLKLTTAYAMLVNGGRRVQPIFIDRVQDRDGRTVERQEMVRCDTCSAPWTGQPAPVIPDVREQVLDPISAYQVVSMSQGVVERGTATVLKSVGKTLGGKTGTTNDYKDAWFVGFSPDLVVGVWAGFDRPRSLGEGETGGRLAAPIFRDFMAEALKNEPDTPFRMPAGVRLVRVDSRTGFLPGPDTTDTIIEAFRPGTEPTDSAFAQPFIIGQGATGIPGGTLGLDVPGAIPAAQPGRPATPQQDDGLGGLY
ncbi:MAG: penicillin-binding protein 1A [Hyphomonadaceae bacterium]|nr:penicillin-binding protein 1A [Hyphomonadaceae bacterium]